MGRRHADGKITRLDPATATPRATIPVGTGPRGVAVGLGSVRVADSRDGTVSRIDPRGTDDVQTIAVGGSPEAVVVAAGRVWVSVQAGASPPAAAIAGGTLHVVQEDGLRLDRSGAVVELRASGLAELAFATCAKLLNYPDRPGSQGTRLVPEVAAAQPRVSRDGRTYTFTVRPGFRFSPPSNGARDRARIPTGDRALREPANRGKAPRGSGRHGRPRRLPCVPQRAGARTSPASHQPATTLTIRLVHAGPRPSPPRMAMPSFCAVPPDTPIRPGGVEHIPSAGPYYIDSHTRDSELVLRRNPNYHGPRPRHFDYDRLPLRHSPPHKPPRSSRPGPCRLRRRGTRRRKPDGHVPARGGPCVTLRRRTSRPTARRAQRPPALLHQPLDRPRLYLLLNPHRGPLFASTRMRRAVNFAVDRAELARTAGPSYSGLPTDQSLPANMPGFRDADIYPLGAPDAQLALATSPAATARAR